MRNTDTSTLKNKSTYVHVQFSSIGFVGVELQRPVAGVACGLMLGPKGEYSILSDLSVSTSVYCNSYIHICCTLLLCPYNTYICIILYYI